MHSEESVRLSAKQVISLELTFEIVGERPHQVRLDGNTTRNGQSDLVSVLSEEADPEVILKRFFHRQFFLVWTDRPVLRTIGAATLVC